MNKRKKTSVAPLMLDTRSYTKKLYKFSWFIYIHSATCLAKNIYIYSYEGRKKTHHFTLIECLNLNDYMQNLILILKYTQGCHKPHVDK